MRFFRTQRCTQLCALALLLIYSTSPVAAIEVAGELFVDLDASTFSTGDANWSNAGSYVDFEAVNGPEAGFIETTPAIFFNGSNAFVGGSLEEPIEAPEGLTGFDPTRTIEVWALNPQINAEETLVSWGKRGGPDGTNMAFNYGNHGNFGAVGHWGGGGPDLGWIDDEFTAGAPDKNEWHHLVYTYAGEDDPYARVYSDGELWYEEDMDTWGGLDTYPDPAIAIAAQWENDGLTLNTGLMGNLAIGRVRIHDGVLTDDQIMANYDEEKAAFVNPGEKPPVPAESLRFSPIHRYDFSNDVADLIGNANGVIIDEGSTQNFEFGNGKLDLSENSGERSAEITEDAYVDLPNGIVSAAANSNSSGAVTFEFWASVSEIHTWQRFGDFGNSNNGEDTSDGGSDADYLLITPNSGRYNNGLEITNHPAGGPEPNVGATGPFPIDEDVHVVAVYDHEDDSNGANGSMHLYMDGELIGSNELAAAFDLRSIEDENNWLGRSQWNDPVFDGSYDEFRIYDYALTEGEVIGNYNSGADTVNTGGGSGDYNNDGLVNAADVNLQAEAIASTEPDLALFDENNDQVVNDVDRYIWVHEHAQTWIGDANLDGEFNSSDLVTVFSAAKYESGQAALWEEGDWNGDQLFSSGDLVAAFSDGGYDSGARPPAAVIPEPSSMFLTLAGLLSVGLAIRRRR
ncbi:MAG: PEP-CTERM sorting domain-containing protein [Planctomycetaceae bacterium]|nr:PEP-CTERM sorting domain-containing protein [Planctomycetaceae bacterium]